MKFAIIDGKLNPDDTIIIKDTLLLLTQKELAIIALRVSGFSQQETAKVVSSSRTSVGTVERLVRTKLRAAMEG